MRDNLQCGSWLTPPTLSFTILEVILLFRSFTEVVIDWSAGLFNS